ncbi:hypothetical protein BDA99DRAFT_541639 [Phascolomyces articulosus]|uniref:F-box domain-containing protein n=1 Tax=Phascolomyces articulosus TaxID=60185 RepID=A0AAD5P9K3_9FUNG|nr:hypothetical protein BDA99DRAFT_541639 [Phascolomyces articulosus]
MTQRNLNLFTNRLPFDVVTEIFSLLEQHECLICLKVCRAWYNQVPQFTQEKWKRVQFWPKEKYDQNSTTGKISARQYDQGLQLVKRCLGSHVTSVKFNRFDNEKVLYKIMQMLIDTGCIQVETLEFYQCATFEKDTFLAFLRQIATSKQLTNLVLQFHKLTQNIASFLYEILQTCPNLTHITFVAHPQFFIHGNSNQGRRHPNDSNSEYSSIDDKSGITTAIQQQQSSSSSAVNTNAITNIFNSLIYMHINAYIPRDTLFEQILKKCPNLQYFFQPKWFGNNPLMKTKSVNIQLDQLVSCCPKLVSFVSECSYDYGPDEMVKQNVFQSSSTASHLLSNDHREKYDQNNNSRKKEFYHLAVSDFQKKDYIIRQLYNSRNTLKYLKLMTCLRPRRPDEDIPPMDNEWSTVFRDLEKMTQLQVLVLDRLNYDTDALIAFLNQCTVLETLVFRTPFTPFDGRMLRSLRTLPTLRTLCLDFFTINEPDQMKQGSTLASLLEHFPSLENLTILDKSFLTLLPLKEISINTLKNLKFLELNNPVVSEDDGNPSETLCTLFQRMTGSNYQGNSESPTLTASSMITKQESPRLEKIRIIDVPGVTSAVLLSISHFCMLKDIELKPNLRTWLPLLHENEKKGEDILFCFFNNLVKIGAPAERVILHPVKYLSYDALEAISQLTRLESLDMQGSGRCLQRHRSSPRELLTIDMKGFLLLLKKSPKLATLYFTHAQFLRQTEKNIVSDLLQPTLKKHGLFRKFNVSSPYPITSASTVFTLTRRPVYPLWQ